MQIIKHASECRWVTTCPQCGCVFVYQGEEITTQPAVEFYGVNKRVGTMQVEDLPEISSVECPECEYKVRIANMAAYRKTMPYTHDMGEYDEC